VVTEVGADTTSVKVGDRVAWTGLLGAYAEYAAVPADRLVPIPQRVSEQQAAAVMLQGMTAHYLSHDTYPLKQGETGAGFHAAGRGRGTSPGADGRTTSGLALIATVSTEEKAKTRPRGGRA